MKINFKINHYVLLQSTAGIVVMAIILLSALVAFSNNRAVNSQVFDAKDVTADILPPPMYLIEMRLVLARVVDGTLPVGQLTPEIDRLEREYLDRVAHWKAYPPHGLETQLLGPQHEAALLFIEQARNAARVSNAGDSDAIRSAVEQAHVAYLAHRKGVDETVSAALTFADKSMVLVDSVRSKTGSVLIALMLGGAVLLLVTALWVRSRIVPPVLHAAHVARRISEGDLSQVVRTDSTGETGELLLALQAMNHSLAKIVTEVRDGSDGIVLGSREIAMGGVDLSARTEDAASSLQSAASSMEQITTTVSQSSGAARQANQLATSATEVAVRGGQVVGQVVSTMEEINQSSKKINDIISVIDGIAFQTNILALNAAVEAARAGEQGRGFAVVAAEVRSLAQRSADAAREIKVLIGASVSKVDAGTRLVADAGETMNEIVGSVKRVSDMIAEITAASGEQSAGLALVTHTVNQLDQMTQQNAALVEESAAAAAGLRDLASRLSNVVQVFRLEPSGELRTDVNANKHMGA